MKSLIAAMALSCMTAAAFAHPDKVVRDGEGTSVPTPFHPVFLLLSAEENEGGVSVYEFEVPAHSPGSPPHTHSNEDEYFYVTAGELSVLSGDEILILNEGDFAALNRGNAHMFWNAGDEPVRMIMVTTGGSFENFMAQVAPALAEAAPSGAAEAGAVIGALAAEHGIIISMDMMPSEAAPYYAPE